MFSNKQLIQKRNELGLSQAEVARQLNISRMSYNNWESGKTKPNQKNLAELAVLFGVDPAFFESEYQIVSNYLKLNPVNQGKADQYVEELLDTQREEEKKRKLSLFLVLRFTLTLPYPQDQVQPFLMNTKLKRFILRKNGMALTLLLGQTIVQWNLFIKMEKSP